MDPTTAMYVSQGIHGIAYGMLLFLVASGVSLIIGMMHIFNMAHAGFFMLSAYFGYQIMAWTGNFWLALLLAPIATGIVRNGHGKIFTQTVKRFRGHRRSHPNRGRRSLHRCLCKVHLGH